MDSLKHSGKKIILSGMSLEELEDLMFRMGESKFRARQLHNWIYSKSVSSVDDMTNLSKKFREALKEIAVITDVKISQRLISSDGTVKYLVEYPDGNCVETVLMRFDNRANLTACISSQVGCAVGCKFCATGKRGFIRNLTGKEIIEQILTIQRDTGLKITNVVYMGQGEPLLNFENVVSSIDFLNKEFEIGIRRITVSTSGIVPKIYELAKLNRQLTLALSLHAPEHELRKKLMPIESMYHLDEVIKSLRYLTEQTGRRVTIEYTVIDHVNDSIEQAKEVNKLLKGLNCNINLIPYNPVENDEFRKPDINRINKFKYILEQSGKKVTVRLERGADIMAACGQLSGQKRT